MTLFFGVILACWAAAVDEAPVDAETSNVATSREGDLEVSLHVDKKNRISIRFTNPGSNEPIQILKPIDGSEWGWCMPHYAFSVDDGKGSEIRKLPRCAHHGLPYSDTSWPEDYVIEIPAGQTRDMPAFMPHLIPADGEYAISIEYIFPPTSETLRGGKHRYPSELWQGRAKSETILVKLKGVPR